MRATLWGLALLGWVAVTAGCARRGSGELNVDEVQGYANAVEQHLRAMRGALRQRDLDSARDEYQEARETLADHREALAAYPEMSELQSAVAEAARTLCYHSVNLALGRFFDAIRAKHLDEARQQLAAARAEHQRCRAEIENRDDYMPLKMNLDSAPQAIAELERELARPALLERMAETRRQLDEKRSAIEAELASLEKQPSQRELAVAIDAHIKALRQDLAAQSAFGGDPAWLKIAADLSGALDVLDRRRAGLVRRGKLLSVAGPTLQQADRAVAQAAGAKDKRAARERLQQAQATYSRGLAILDQLFKEEPALARYRLDFQGRQRTGAWLKRHLVQGRKKAERSLRRLGAKPAPRPKAKKKRRRRRIRRW